MASVSYGLNRGVEDQPEDITIGTVAASGNDVVLSIDLTKSLNVKDVVLILQAFTRRLEGNEGTVDIANN